jgi:hypothetical protein
MLDAQKTRRDQPLNLLIGVLPTDAANLSETALRGPAFTVFVCVIGDPEQDQLSGGRGALLLKGPNHCFDGHTEIPDPTTPRRVSSAGRDQT